MPARESESNIISNTTHLPERCTRFLLIRHAHVDTGGGGGRMCGWLDLPLSSRGEDQLHSFKGGALPDRQPHALCTSPLMRARATADALARAWQLQPQLEPDLREIHCGTLEGVAIATIRRDHASLWQQNAAQSDDAFRWPGGESYQQFRARVLSALRRIAATHVGQSVAIVTHCGVITQVIGTLENQTAAAWEHHRAAPFSATELLWCGDAPHRLQSFNVETWWKVPQPRDE
jgi:broad specificity phosphatase PhoE